MILLVALALFVVWRLMEALLDPEHHGRDLRGLALRGVYLCSAFTYGALTWKCLRVLFQHTADSDDSRAQQAAALAMSEPLGRWLVLIAGAVIVIVALVWIARSIMLDVNKRLGRADEELSPWLAALGRVGHLARGLVLAVVGGFFVYAAWIFQPRQARSMSGALRAIQHQPFGDWLLARVGIGLAAFGLFGLAMARYRRFNCGSGVMRKLKR